MDKEILRKILERKNKGLFSHSDLFNAIGNDKKEKEIHELISDGYIEEVVEDKQVKTPECTTSIEKITFYRLSPKGRRLVSPIYKKLWYFIKKKTKTIAAITATAIISAIITWLITNYLNN